MENEFFREELYRQFYDHRQRMGDPTAMKSPQEVFNTPGEDEVLAFVPCASCYSTVSIQERKIEEFVGAERMPTVPAPFHLCCQVNAPLLVSFDSMFLRFLFVLYLIRSSANLCNLVL